MFNTGMTPADLAAVTGSNDGWGNGSWLWFLIVIFALFGGWGGYGNNSNGAETNYVLASDFATLQRQIDSATTQTQNLVYQGNDQLQRQVTSIGNGISSLGYDQLAQFNNVNTNVLQSANATQNAINNCCCTNREGFANVNYNIATQANALTSAVNTGFCQTNFNAQSNTRDIVDSQNAGTQAILAKLNQMESNAQAEKIATLQAENQRLAFASSQQEQNAYLISRLLPSPQPAYVVNSPYVSTYNGCGCSCGC